MEAWKQYSVIEIALDLAPACGSMLPAPLHPRWLFQEFLGRLRQDSQVSALSLGVALALHPSPSIHRVLLYPEEHTIIMAQTARCQRCSLFCLVVRNASSPLFSWNFWKGINRNNNDHCSNDSCELLNMVTLCHHSKWLTCNSFDPQNNPTRQMLFYWWGDWGTEELTCLRLLVACYSTEF